MNKWIISYKNLRDEDRESRNISRCYCVHFYRCYSFTPLLFKEKSEHHHHGQLLIRIILREQYGKMLWNLLLFVCEYHIVQNVNNQHQQLTSLPSSLPDEQEDKNDDDSDYDDADATETCASDESLTESLESIDWSTDSKDNELYYLCWDSDEEILVIGEDDNRGIASGGGSDSIGGSGVASIVPRKSCCWCPHDTSLNHFNTVLGLEAEEQAIYCGVSKKNGQGFYLHGRNCAYCSAKFVVNETPSNNGKNEFRPTRRKPAWACKWMTKTNKVKKKCTFALCNACFIVLSECQHKRAATMKEK